jgi:hypothetical protein
MKATLRISILLNAGLLCSLMLILADKRKGADSATPRVIAETANFAHPPAVIPASLAAAKQVPKAFRWSQLESTDDYRIYVANLRAIGCPEPTVEEIVIGDAERGFSFERNQLGLDGSGSGKWSRLHEAQTVAALLGKPVPVVETETATTSQNARIAAQQDAGTAVAETPAGTQTAGQPSDTQIGTQNARQASRWMTAYVPSYPLAFQKVNLQALNFSADQQAAIQQVQQQFVNAIGGLNQNPNDPAYLAKWQTAQTDADAALLALLGRQGYMAYQQQQYYNWYEPQVLAANSAGKPLIINPGSFSK